jgi:hypothetical protein
MATDPILSVGCVSYRSGQYVALNQRLTRFLNPDAPVQWIVVANDTKKPQRLACQVDKGTKVLEKAPVDRSKDFPKGAHHAGGLQKVIATATTRFLLLIDPDFFIVRRGWIDDCLTHMLDGKLSFFGAAHDPRRVSKFRYFPSVMCTFVDLERVDRRLLDFSPGSYHSFTRDGRRERREQREGRFRAPVAFRKAVREIQHFALRPSYLGKVQDTGYRVHERFFRDPHHRAEHAIPVLRPEVEWPRAFPGRRSLFAAFRRFHLSPPLLPESFSLIPRRAGSVTASGFRECGFPTVSDFGWEEHMWRGAPFAFHVTRHSRFHSMAMTIDFADVERAVSELTGLVVQGAKS